MKLKNILVFGTDGDKQLSDAFAVSLPDALHLLCDMHMKDNIYGKIKKLGIDKQIAKDIVSDIFGCREQHIPGLVDVTDSQEFENKMDDLMNKWSQAHPKGNQFFVYFKKYKAADIMNCMASNLRSMSGLGYPPQPYLQNANECLNATIKNDLKADLRAGRRMNLKPEEFCQRLQVAAKQQEDQIKMALIGKGEYRLKPEYKHLEVPQQDYWRKSAMQRQAVFERYVKLNAKHLL